VLRQRNYLPGSPDLTLSDTNKLIFYQEIPEQARQALDSRLKKGYAFLPK
jgi:hypothetical protein